MSKKLYTVIAVMLALTLSLILKKTAHAEDAYAIEFDGYSFQYTTEGYVDNTADLYENYVTFTFTGEVCTDTSSTQDINTEIYLFLSAFPYVNLDVNSGYAARSTDKRVYLIIEGQEYLVPSVSTVITVPGGFNKVAVRVEEDITYQHNSTDDAFFYGFASCTPAELYVSTIGLSDKGWFESINGGIISMYKNISTGNGYLKNIANYLNTQMTSLGVIMDKFVESNKFLSDLKTQLTAFQTSVENALTTSNSYLVKIRDYLNYGSAYLNTIQKRVDITLTSMRDSIGTYIANAQGAVTQTLWDIWTNTSVFFEERFTALYKQLTAFQTSVEGKVDEVLNELTATRGAVVAKINEVITALTGDGDTKKEDSTSGKLDTALGDFDKSESAVTDSAFENMNDFTIPKDGFNSYGTQFVTALSLVSGMLQSIYVSMGEFSILITVVFAMTIVSMLTGLFRFFKG